MFDIVDAEGFEDDGVRIHAQLEAIRLRVVYHHAALLVAQIAEIELQRTAQVGDRPFLADRVRLLQRLVRVEVSSEGAAQVGEAAQVRVADELARIARDVLRDGVVDFEVAHADSARESLRVALAQLRSLFGSRVDRVFAGGARLVTHWEADPWVRGAYCYARPGEAEARDRLAQPQGDGHLCFAGEACNVPYAGTLAGAWLSGQEAAAQVVVD